MRLTTKIILGIVGGIFAVSLLFIIGFSFSDRKHYDYQDIPGIEVSLGEMTDVEIDAFKVVCIYEPQNSGIRFHPNPDLYIHPIPEGEEKQKLSAPEKLKDYMKTYAVNDTLMIELNLDRLVDDIMAGEENKSPRRFSTNSDINLHLSTHCVDVINSVRGTTVWVDKVKADLIKINSMNIRIDSCEATSVSPFGKGSFMIRNSTVQSLNIDLDHIGSWVVENCNIQEENLTGSNQHRVSISKREAKALNWLPKNKDARLNTEIQGGESVKLIFE